MFDASSKKLLNQYFGIIFMVALICSVLVGYQRMVAFMIVFFGLSAYFLPTLIAGLRKNNAFTSIFALNLLAGWSIIGWVASLIWSLYKPSLSTTVIESNSTASELEHLAQLKDKGILTEEEFNHRKSTILAH